MRRYGYNPKPVHLAAYCDECEEDEPICGKIVLCGAEIEGHSCSPETEVTCATCLQLGQDSYECAGCGCPLDGQGV